ncbi:hypothetical protein SAMN05660464_1380 [Geodermatophilus dictyosporus]|uniref:Uncharacterized protein n=1 Tax=Geodermatophilus dictyosporus TaxID=1523247 RepID=A0A1I5KSM6_9ACTN|nr:hypothetical protein [Geodermatophilus dictyosporus]SFO87962.1 hypothetical protein SAMN05660464_1380 [Geodermatophilus dictyosporus]
MTGPSSEENDPPGGQPGYGAPGQQPGGLSPHGGGTPGARPPQVLTAAVLGFVAALFLLLVAFTYFALATLAGVLALFGVLFLALAAGCIWGGVQAIRGTGSRVLLVAAAVTAGLVLFGIVTALVTGTGLDVFSVLVLVLLVGSIALLQQPVSKRYFASRGAR